MVSFLQGKMLGVQGDSITASFGNAWQNVVVARTGMVLAYQDARAARSFRTALECWGNPAQGAAPTTFTASYLIAQTGTTCGQSQIGIADGTSFAKALANVDVLVVDLGTNDQVDVVGQLGDSTTTNTLYGIMRWVVEAYLTAKPTLRLVLVAPQMNGYALPEVTQQTVVAMLAYGNSMGVPVIDMYKLGGVNAISSPVLTLDGTHPNPFGYASFYGPVIAQGLQKIF